MWGTNMIEKEPCGERKRRKKQEKKKEQKG